MITFSSSTLVKFVRLVAVGAIVLVTTTGLDSFVDGACIFKVRATGDIRDSNIASKCQSNDVATYCSDAGGAFVQTTWNNAGACTEQLNCDHVLELNELIADGSGTLMDEYYAQFKAAGYDCTDGTLDTEYLKQMKELLNSGLNPKNLLGVDNMINKFKMVLIMGKNLRSLNFINKDAAQKIGEYFEGPCEPLRADMITVLTNKMDEYFSAATGNPTAKLDPSKVNAWRANKHQAIVQRINNLKTLVATAAPGAKFTAQELTTAGVNSGLIAEESAMALEPSFMMDPNPFIDSNQILDTSAASSPSPQTLVGSTKDALAPPLDSFYPEEFTVDAAGGGKSSSSPPGNKKIKTPAEFDELINTDPTEARRECLTMYPKDVKKQKKCTDRVEEVVKANTAKKEKKKEKKKQAEVAANASKLSSRKKTTTSPPANGKDKSTTKKKTNEQQQQDKKKSKDKTLNDKSKQNDACSKPCAARDKKCQAAKKKCPGSAADKSTGASSKEICSKTCAKTDKKCQAAKKKASCPADSGSSDAVCSKTCAKSDTKCQAAKKKASCPGDSSSSDAICSQKCDKTDKKCLAAKKKASCPATDASDEVCSKTCDKTDKKCLAAKKRCPENPACKKPCAKGDKKCEAAKKNCPNNKDDKECVKECTKGDKKCEAEKRKCEAAKCKNKKPCAKGDKKCEAEQEKCGKNLGDAKESAAAVKKVVDSYSSSCNASRKSHNYFCYGAKLKFKSSLYQSTCDLHKKSFGSQAYCQPCKQRGKSTFAIFGVVKSSQKAIVIVPLACDATA